MNKVITQKELKEKIGEMVLTFGNLETAISASIQLLVEKCFITEVSLSGRMKKVIYLIPACLHRISLKSIWSILKLNIRM